MHSIRILVVLGITLLVLLSMQSTFSKPKSTIKSNISSTISPTPSPTKRSVINNRTSQLPFVYPNAELQTISQDELTLESVDAPDQIIKWYEAMLIKKDVKNKTIIKNTINNLYRYEISGNVQNYVLSIKIEKKNEEKLTKITISVKNS